MRVFVYILSLLLILWITGSSHWYVCRIRGDCKNSPRTEENIPPVEEVNSADEALAREASALQASIEEARNFLVSSGTQKVFFTVAASATDMSVIPADYLSKLKFYLENRPEVKINVTGHTDNTGTEASNLRLGSSRADFVKSFLVNSGINEDRIQTFSKAFSEPAASNNNREGRARNRRKKINVLI